MANITNKERLGAMHRKIREIQALLRAVQLAQEGADDDLASCMVTARRLLGEIDDDLYLLDEGEGKQGPSEPPTATH